MKDEGDCLGRPVNSTGLCLPCFREVGKDVVVAVVVDEEEAVEEEELEDEEPVEDEESSGFSWRG